MITDSIILSMIADLVTDAQLCYQGVFSTLRCGSRVPLPAPGDSGLPGSLKGVLSGPHPAVLGPLPARRQQRLARLAEGSCSGLHPFKSALHNDN